MDSSSAGRQGIFLFFDGWAPYNPNSSAIRMKQAKAGPMLRINHSSDLAASALSSSVLVLNRGYMAVHVINVRQALVLLCRECCEVIDNLNGQFANYALSEWLEFSELRRMELDEFGSWDDAAMAHGHAAMDDELDDEWIRSVRCHILAPRIVRLTDYDKYPKSVLRFNRRNLFARDHHRCQYCRRALPNNQLTLDHVLPRSRGGETSWENVVCACVHCNTAKGDRTPCEASMPLMRKPAAPQHHPLLVAKLRNPKYASWRTFLPELAAIADQCNEGAVDVV